MLAAWEWSSKAHHCRLLSANLARNSVQQLLFFSLLLNVFFHNTKFTFSFSLLSILFSRASWSTFELSVSETLFLEETLRNDFGQFTQIIGSAFCKCFSSHFLNEILLEIELTRSTSVDQLSASELWVERNERREKRSSDYVNWEERYSHRGYMRSQSLLIRGKCWKNSNHFSPESHRQLCISVKRKHSWRWLHVTSRQEAIFSGIRVISPQTDSHFRRRVNLIRHHYEQICFNCWLQLCTTFGNKKLFFEQFNYFIWIKTLKKLLHQKLFIWYESFVLESFVHSRSNDVFIHFVELARVDGILEGFGWAELVKRIHKLTQIHVALVVASIVFSLDRELCREVMAHEIA